MGVAVSTLQGPVACPLLPPFHRASLCTQTLAPPGPTLSVVAPLRAVTYVHFTNVAAWQRDSVREATLVCSNMA
jgi:hypothetical protein